MFASSRVGWWKMKEKPELLSPSSCARRREQKASTSKTSSSCVHMRLGRAKYDAALFQSFCQVFAHIIKLLSSSRKCLKYLRCDVKMTSAKGPFASFCFFHLELWPPGQQKPRTCCKVFYSPVAMAFHDSFYHSFYTYCSLEIGQKTLLHKWRLIFFFVIVFFSIFFWEHLVLS